MTRYRQRVKVSLELPGEGVDVSVSGETQWVAVRGGTRKMLHSGERMREGWVWRAHWGPSSRPWVWGSLSEDWSRAAPRLAEWGSETGRPPQGPWGGLG